MQDTEMEAKFESYKKEINKVVDDHHDDIYRKVDNFMIEIREIVKPQFNTVQLLGFIVGLLMLLGSLFGFLYVGNQNTGDKVSTLEKQVTVNTNEVMNNKKTADNLELWTNTFSIQMNTLVVDVAILRTKQEMK